MQIIAINQQQINQQQTMSSREIAELTGKDHKNVCRDIRTMLDALGKDRLSFEHIYKDAYGRDQTEYRIDRELTLTLISGYDIPLRHRVVTRLAELENAKSSAVLPAPTSIAKQAVIDYIEVGQILGVPLHISQVEGVKSARLLTGVDFSPLLLSAPAQNDIRDDEMMLEPNDLAKRFGIKSGIAVNRMLADAGLQEKDGGAWTPTELGAPHCAAHQWVSGGKSGYNLKWKVSVVASVLEREAA